MVHSLTTRLPMSSDVLPSFISGCAGLEELAIRQLTDSGGLALPNGPGSPIETLRSLSALACAGRAKALIQLALEQADTFQLRALLTAIEVLPSSAVVHLFGHPLAYLDTLPTGQPEDAANDTRLLTERAFSVARHLLGRAEVEDLCVVMPPSTTLQAGLYLPHLCLSVRSPAGPVAFHQAQGRLQITWSDGVGMTLAVGARLTADNIPTDLLQAGRIVVDSWVDGDRNATQALNGCAALANTFSIFEPLSVGRVAESQAIFKAGRSLLHQVWPASFTELDLFLRGALFLKRQPFVRSHTPKTLPGLVLLTSDSPMKVADVLSHEISHVRMNLVLEFDPLILDDGVCRHPSPWRSDLRPLIGVLYGVHAFLNVCHFYARYKDTEGAPAIARQVYEHQCTKLKKGWQRLQRYAVPTALGESLFAELENGIDSVCK
ncbi:MAG: HEXXH motif-containing putative peptide modification protein [Cyanobacteria bacterium P01_A01_bin.116]